MPSVLIRLNSGPYFFGYIHAGKAQDIEVENDETHRVGHDPFARLVSDPGPLSQGFRVTIRPSSRANANRTETVDKDESLGIHGVRGEAEKFLSILRPGAKLAMLEFCSPGRTSMVLRAASVTVVQTGAVSGGTMWGQMEAERIFSAFV